MAEITSTSTEVKARTKAKATRKLLTAAKIEDLLFREMSDPYIILVSTPNAPDGLYNSIENEPESQCIYKRLKMDWTKQNLHS